MPAIRESYDIGLSQVIRWLLKKLGILSYRDDDSTTVGHSTRLDGEVVLTRRTLILPCANHARSVPAGHPVQPSPSPNQMSSEATSNR